MAPIIMAPAAGSKQGQPRLFGQPHKGHVPAGDLVDEQQVALEEHAALIEQLREQICGRDDSQAQPTGR